MIPDIDTLRNWIAAQSWFDGGQTVVITAGSFNDLGPGDQLDEGSDLDLWSFHGTDTPLPPQAKHLLGSTTIEIDHFPLAKLDAGSELAADFRLAPNLVSPTVLFDPLGIVAPAVQWVASAYREPCYVAQRLKAAEDESRVRLANYISSPCTTLDLLLGAMGLPNLALIASCRRPTVRKAFINAGQLFREAGKPELHDHVLRGVGAESLRPCDIQDMTALCLEILTASLQFKKTPFWGDFEIQSFRIDSFKEFATTSTGCGFHREVTVYIALMAYWGMLPLWMDLAEEQRTGYEALYNELTGYIGWNTLEKRREAAERLLTILDTWTASPCLESLHPLT